MTTNNGKRHRECFEWESSSESLDPVCRWRRLAAMTARTDKLPLNVIVRAVGIYWAVIWFLGQKNSQFGDHVAKARKTQDKCVGTVLKPHFRHESLNDKNTAVRIFFIKKTRTSGLFVHVSCISKAIRLRKTWIDSFIDIHGSKRVLFFESALFEWMEVYRSSQAKVRTALSTLSCQKSVSQRWREVYVRLRFVNFLNSIVKFLSAESQSASTAKVVLISRNPEQEDFSVSGSRVFNRQSNEETVFRQLSL